MITYVTAMMAKMELNRKAIAASNLAILQNAKITIEGKQVGFPLFLEILGKQMGKQREETTKQAAALTALEKIIGQNGSGLFVPLANALKKDMAEQQAEIKKEIGSLSVRLLK